MTLLSWRADYEVGVSQIDAEHQYLFSLINEFNDRHMSGEPRVEVLHVLNRLVKYAEEHFQHEEGLKSKHTYPRLDHHHELHDKLFSSLFELNEKLSKGVSNINIQTMRFLKDWLIDHILKEDMDIGLFLRRQAIQAEKAAQENARKEAQKKAAEAEKKAAKKKTAKDKAEAQKKTNS